VSGIHAINHNNKLLFNLVFVGKTLRHERYHDSKSSQQITQLTVTYEQNQMTEKTQLNTTQ